MRGTHCIRSWCSTQKSVTLSSAEAELVAAVRATTEGIGLTQLAEGWGLQMSAEIHVDSSAALAVTARRGNGKLRHVRVGQLWIQELAERKEVRFSKVDGYNNPADLCTKYLTAEYVERLMRGVNQHFVDGHAVHRLFSLQVAAHHPGLFWATTCSKGWPV